MLGEGEFEKRIGRQKKHYAKILVGPPISMSAAYVHIENLLENQKKMLEEAEKEFPWYELEKNPDGTINFRVKSAYWLVEVIEWFENYFKGSFS